MSSEITKAEWLAEYEKITEQDQNGKDEILYRKAVDFVVNARSSSGKLLAAGIGISYQKALVLLSRMEIDGVVSPYRAGTTRKVLLKRKTSI